MVFVALAKATCWLSLLVSWLLMLWLLQLLGKQMAVELRQRIALGKLLLSE